MESYGLLDDSKFGVLLAGVYWGEYVLVVGCDEGEQRGGW